MPCCLIQDAPSSRARTSSDSYSSGSSGSHQATEATLASSSLAKLPLQRGPPNVQLSSDSTDAHAIGFEL